MGVHSFNPKNPETILMEQQIMHFPISMLSKLFFHMVVLLDLLIPVNREFRGFSIGHLHILLLLDLVVRFYHRSFLMNASF